MIRISAVQFDPAGSITINELPSSELNGVSRRVSRVATLDQGVAYNDGGYSDGDRTFIVRWRSDQATDDHIQRMVRVHSRWRVSTREGVFICLPQNFRPDGIESSITLLPIERTSE